MSRQSGTKLARSRDQVVTKKDSKVPEEARKREPPRTDERFKLLSIPGLAGKTIKDVEWTSIFFK